MNKSLEKNKSVVVAIVVFIFAIIIYNYFFASSVGSVASESDAAQTVGNNVLALNAKLGSVSFNTTIFTSPAYSSLVDFTPPLPAGNPGRTNPFAPIGQ